MLIRFIIPLFMLLLLPAQSVVAQEFHLARLKYGGGGDWYSDPSSLPNLIRFIQENTNIKLSNREHRTELTDGDLFSHPYLYMTGHGNVKFSREERSKLREYLLSGGFMHVDDNYGLDESFRRELKLVFPKKSLVELPHDHALFTSYFSFPHGLPKVHEHDGKAPQALALFHDGRMILLYTYESDLGDGWENPEVHEDGLELHRRALEMGTNIIVYALLN